ncbi:MAG TPA: SDR family NAD(P)-dependent oxidoreductase [Candidatus Thermoplasmatota archaeon]|nr:SDR family NAD(P)-dependent oxidoreductase [Candidatus Thermoplasmatota archaeon]
MTPQSSRPGTRSSTGRLANKVAIVTGGATGIGEAIVKRFAEEGASVLVAGLESDPVDAVVQEVRGAGGEALAYKGDLSREEDARRCVETAVSELGGVEVLVNNAGVFLEMNPVEEYSIESFDRTLANNVRATFLVTKFAMPHLKRSRGCIVSAGSESGKVGLPQNAIYGGTKAWIHAFTQALAVEGAKSGVRANCVCPGAIDTAWTHAETGPMDEEAERMILEATPLGRRGTPEEMANVYLFLASDEASYVTGALWSADGGITIAKGSVGSEVPKSLKREPEGHLDLEHQREGLRGKPVRR